MNELDKVREKLKLLRLNRMSLELEEVLAETVEKNTTPIFFLEKLVDREIEYQQQRSIEYRIKQSKLPQLVTIDQFDFNHHKSRSENKQRILNLLDLTFSETKTDIVFMGQPGVGKTFLSQCIILQACRHNQRVLFTKAMDMINQLIAADINRSLHTKLDYYRKPQILAIDELGYLSLNQQGSDLLFQVISGRHSVASTIITTNRTFRDWGEIFYNTTVASAVADRFAANSEIILLEKSYRPELKKKSKHKKAKIN
jgi:DNA replication protein DnaC